MANPKLPTYKKKLEAELRRLRALYKLPAKDPEESRHQPQKKNNLGKKKAA